MKILTETQLKNLLSSAYYLGKSHGDEASKTSRQHQEAVDREHVEERDSLFADLIKES